ncbi:MAG: hypothetical protein M1308_08760 [Actinobacteria bacterium]|nr:hypothetical protein [Actinomycetota bacterium]
MKVWLVKLFDCCMFKGKYCDVRGREGFVIGPTQHLLKEIPLENIFALYDTAYNYG